MQVVAISSIKPNPSNPRLIKDDKFHKLVQSLKDFPEMASVRPIVVNQDMVILGGNMRFKAMKEAKWKEVPVQVVDWDEAKQREFIIKDNVGFGEWDWEDLANSWNAEELEAWGLDVPVGFTEEPEAEEDDYVMPDEIQTDIVLGDLFEIGEHRLLCGDSTDSDTVAKLMDGQKADLLLTDPPYGIGIDGQKESKAKNPKHNRKNHEFLGWDSSRPEQSTFALLRSFANTAIIWGGNYFADLLPATRGWIYWSKGQDGLTMSDGELAWTSEDKPLRAITVNRASLQGSVHPTQKPIEVMTFCLNWSEKNNLVLDSYLGSGSTMVAAHQLKRKCYGMELEPKYCQVIVDRMLKLDPTLTIKRNGQPYLTEGTLQGQNKDAKTGES
jgi:site-specific DNA-methyltransferase (adenine-specific)